MGIYLVYLITELSLQHTILQILTESVKLIVVNVVTKVLVTCVKESLPHRSCEALASNFRFSINITEWNGAKMSMDPIP
jgi:hypothetical protein